MSGTCWWEAGRGKWTPSLSEDQRPESSTWGFFFWGTKDHQLPCKWRQGWRMLHQVMHATHFKISGTFWRGICMCCRNAPCFCFVFYFSLGLNDIWSEIMIVWNIVNFEFYTVALMKIIVIWAINSPNVCLPYKIVNATLRAFPISSLVCAHSYAHFNSQLQ